MASTFTLSHVGSVFVGGGASGGFTASGVSDNSLLVAVMMERSGLGESTLSVTDSNGATWTKADSLDNLIFNNTARVGTNVWYRVYGDDPDDDGTDFTITANCTNGSAFYSITTFEVAASDAGWVWDFLESAANGSGTASINGTSSGSTAGAAADEILTMAVAIARGPSNLSADIDVASFTNHPDNVQLITPAPGVSNRSTVVAAIEADSLTGGTARSTTITSDETETMEGAVYQLVFENTAAASSDTNVNASIEALTLTEFAAAVANNVNVSANTKALTVTTYQASLLENVEVDASVEALTLTEYGADVAVDVAINASAESLTLTEYSADVAVVVLINASAELLTLTEYSADVALDVAINAFAESLTLTEYSADIAAGGNVTVSASFEALELAEYSASIGFDVGVSATSEALTLTENPATIGVGFDVDANVEALTLSTYPVSFVRNVEVLPEAEALRFRTWDALVEGGYVRLSLAFIGVGGKLMTIQISENDPRVMYEVAEGVEQTVFTVPFAWWNDSDLNVYVDGVLKSEGSDWTVTTGGDGSPGSITFNPADPGETQQVTGGEGGSYVVIFRRGSNERTTDFSQGATINRAALNEQLDYLHGLIADLNDKVTRSVHAIDKDPFEASMALPEIAQRKGGILSFSPTTGLPEVSLNATIISGLVAGSAGPGVAPGGGSGDFLVKASGVDYDTEWISTLPVAQGGTGGTSASTARTALGLEIGVDIQAYDANTVKTTATQTLTNKTLTSPTLNTPTLNAPTLTASVVDTETASWTGTESLDPANGDVQTITLTGDVTTLNDSLADGESVILEINDGSAHSITWPTITWVSGDGSAPTLQTTGETIITVWKSGTTLKGFAANGA